MVAVVGKPNAGKSTLLNRIVGTKLSIVSPKPQSTRDRVVGILTDADSQIILLDTPGLLDPKYELQRAMRSTALEALKDADVIVYLVDASEGPAVSLVEAAALSSTPKAPVITAFNKADRLKSVQRDELQGATPTALFISAANGDGVNELLKEIRTHLPESPFLYPEDEISTQQVRFFVAELVRETALEQLSEELPYSIACQVEEFREDRQPLFIRAVLYVERDSQKRILIGAKGQQIRSIGQAARAKIEAFVEQNVYLDLWVKVLPNWRKSATALARFGYRVLESSKK